MQLEFGYGSGVQTVELPQENLLGVLHAAPIEHERRGPDAVSWALAHPIGSAPLHALARPGQRIAIVTSDITRPLPSYQILPGVLVSQGGAPKDANLYQTQKALDNAKHAVKDGGTIILIGACPEGLGSKTFSDWLLAAPTAHSMVERISRDFQLGGHKAAAIAMVLEKASIDLISEMDDDFVRRIFLEPKPSAQAALDAAFRKYGPSATVLAMPHGGSTLPYLQDAGPDHSRT
ncbi:MAG: lactate racemase domain-containing protein [Clostridiales bacterium]|nr:lactate racemase domain-containing protein [Clostridiales bacterium]